MIQIEINAHDLLRWNRMADRLIRDTPVAVQRALNTYGDNVVRKVVEYVVSQTGMEPDDVVDLIEVQKATRYDLTWAMDATAAMNAVGADDTYDRPWVSRDDSKFEQERLVKIVTMNDGDDCEACQDAAHQSPYTMAQIEVIQAKWANYQGKGGPAGPAELRTNLIHPNCRCTIAPWYSVRRLPVTFRERGSGAAPPELFTPNELARTVQDELALVMQATRD